MEIMEIIKAGFACVCGVRPYYLGELDCYVCFECGKTSSDETSFVGDLAESLSQRLKEANPS
jgi:hypothetical protein